MSENINIIGIENLWRPDYQVAVKKQIQNIFGNKDKISIDELKNNKVFNDLFHLNNDSLKSSIFSNIQELAGVEIDFKEMQAIYTLLDGNSEENLGVDKEAIPRKYVFDNKLNEVSEETAIMKIQNDYDKTKLQNTFNLLLKLFSIYDE